MQVAQGEEIKVNAEDNHEEVLQAFQVIAGDPQFQQMSQEGKLNIQQFVAQHQQFLTQ